MTPEEALAAFEDSGAMLTGHFVLSSGRHSDRYVQKARLLERPELAMRAAREIASWYPGIEVVVAPAVGAVSLGFAVALAAGGRSVFTERVEDRMTLRRGFELAPGERTLVVEDIVTTGGSAREVVDVVAERGAELLGVAALVDRSAGSVGLPIRALLRVEARTWAPQDCPLCRAGRPFDSPGSRRLASSSEAGR